MNTIVVWLDKEQEHKLALEIIEYHKNKAAHNKKLALAIAKQDIAFVKMRNAGVKNLHPRMLEKLKNTV